MLILSKNFRNNLRKLEKNRFGKIVTPAGTRLTKTQWEEVCAQYNNRCVACGSDAPVTVDHVLPLHLGGLSTKDNVQPLCEKCNSKKGNQHIDYRENV